MTLKFYGLNRYMLERMERWIDAQPAVDAVSVVHGEWKPLRGRYAECSVCEEAYYMPHMRWSNFCPNCGADMRKGADDV